jgi:hypothetical protein
MILLMMTDKIVSRGSNAAKLVSNPGKALTDREIDE